MEEDNASAEEETTNEVEVDSNTEGDASDAYYLRCGLINTRGYNSKGRHK